MAAGSGTIRRLDIVFNVESGEATAELQSVNRAGDEASNALETAEGKAKALTVAFGVLATTTTVLGAAMAQMASLGMDLDTTLATIRVTSQATEEEMESIRSTIAQLGADLPVTMRDVTTAFQELSFAGFSAEESIAAVGAVSNLAIAGNLGVAESARIVTSALNAFGLEADQAGAVASALGATFANSATNIQEMGHALEYIGPVAGQAGQSIIEVTAALGVLADAGIRASRAGTGLQQFFSALINPTGKAQEALESLGLTIEDFVDEQGNIKDMTELVAILNERMAGLTEAEQLALLIDLFGQRGARAIAPLIANVDEFNEKVGEAAAADLKTAIEDFTELEGEEIEAIDAVVEFDLRPGMTEQEILDEMVAQSENLSEEELSAQIMYTFNVDERTADLLTEDIMAGASAQELANGLNDVTTEADLAAAQMETVGGMVEYIDGTIESMSYTIYTGFRPALKLVLGLLISLLDPIAENETALKFLGGALALVFGGLVALTGIAGAAAAAFWAQAFAASSSATALGVKAGASYALAFAQKAATAATWLLTASMGDLTRALTLARGAAIGSTLSLAGLKKALLGAAMGVRTLFASLGPIGWAILLIGAAITAYMTNFLGFRDFVDDLVGKAGGLYSILKKVIGPFYGLARVFAKLTGFAIGGLLRGIAWAFRAINSAIQGTIAWFDDLPLLGKLVVGALFPPLAILWATQEALEWLIDGYDRLRDAIDLPDIDLADDIRDVLDELPKLDWLLENSVDSVEDLAKAFGFLVGLAQFVADEIHDIFWNLQDRLSNMAVIGWIIPDPKGEPKRRGEEAGDSIVEGIKSKLVNSSAIGRAGSALAGAIGAYLPASDAEVGPLSNLSERGRSLVETFLSGVESASGTLSLDPILTALTGRFDPFGGAGVGGGVGGLLEQMPDPLSVLDMAGVTDEDDGDGRGRGPPPAGAAGAGGDVYNVDIEMRNEFGPGTDEEGAKRGLEEGARDLVDRVQRALADDIERSRTNPAPQ